MANRICIRYTVIGIFIFILCILYQYQLIFHIFSQNSCNEFIVYDENNKFEYNRYMPVIFIGGLPRSGTTLLRVMLDTHPDVYCGEETRVIPRVLELRRRLNKNPMELERLKEIKIIPEILDSAVGLFITEILIKRSHNANRICTKDPLIYKDSLYLHKYFPNAKFIFMIRDGRAVVHSMITRNVFVLGFRLNDVRQCLREWNNVMIDMMESCREMGESFCLPVYYEQLVLHPKQNLEMILKFLNVSWNDAVLHHEQFVAKNKGIVLSKLGPSTSQVIKPVNLEPLSKWVGYFPDDVIKDMNNIAPVLSVFGYDPFANPPNYGNPDTFVLNNMKEIEKNKVFWDEKEHEVNHMKEATVNDISKKTTEIDEYYFV